MSKKRCEIICVGTELLLGDITNTNAQYIAQGLSRLGLDLYVQTVVGDNERRLEQAIRAAMARAEILLFTGGLGPTSDDITKEVVARCLGTTLYVDNDALHEIRSFYELTKRPMPISNEKQALMPRDGQMLPNAHGTAPGCLIFGKEGHIAALMPGPPREMRPMLDEQVLPYLTQFSDGGLYSQAVRVVGLGESRMAEMLGDLIEQGNNPTLAPYAKDGEAMVRVTAKAHSKEEAQALCQPVIDEILHRLGRHAYGVDVDSLEAVIADMLAQQGFTAAFVEAGSGGMAAQRLQRTAQANQVCGPGLSAPSLHQLQGLLGLTGGLPEDPAQACAALAWACASKLGTGCAVVVEVKERAIACAVVLGNKVRQYAQALPSRGAEYYRVQATQSALDMLRLMLEEASILKTGKEC